MSKPSITLDITIAPLVFDKARFEEIATRSHPYNHITLYPPNEGKLLIAVVNTDALNPAWLGEIAGHIAQAEYLQAYILWDCEYPFARKYNPYGEFSNPAIKNVFTPNLGAAIDYGVELVAKACKHGIYG